MIDGGIVRLPVKDVDASVRFYVETLGMKLVELSEDGWSRYHCSGHGGYTFRAISAADLLAQPDPEPATTKPLKQ